MLVACFTFITNYLCQTVFCFSGVYV